MTKIENRPISQVPSLSGSTISAGKRELLALQSLQIYITRESNRSDKDMNRLSLCDRDLKELGFGQPVVQKFSLSEQGFELRYQYSKKNPGESSRQVVEVTACGFALPSGNDDHLICKLEVYNFGKVTRSFSSERLRESAAEMKEENGTRWKKHVRETKRELEKLLKSNPNATSVSIGEDFWSRPQLHVQGGCYREQIRLQNQIGVFKGVPITVLRGYDWDPKDPPMPDTARYKALTSPR